MCAEAFREMEIEHQNGTRTAQRLPRAEGKGQMMMIRGIYNVYWTLVSELGGIRGRNTPLHKPKQFERLYRGPDDDKLYRAKPKTVHAFETVSTQCLDGWVLILALPRLHSPCNGLSVHRTTTGPMLGCNIFNW
jgi:hypothetical protein